MHDRTPRPLWQTDPDDLLDDQTPCRFPVCPECGLSFCQPYCDSVDHS